MKFHLNHDPANKTLTIPRAALQLSGLAETSDLTIHTENGCVLLLPEKLSVAQTLKTFQLLTAINAELLFRLAKAALWPTAPKMTHAMDAIGKKSVFRMSCRCVCWQRPASTRRKAILNVW